MTGLFTPGRIIAVLALAVAVFASGFTVAEWRNGEIIADMRAAAAEDREQAVADAQAIEDLGDIAAEAVMAEYALRTAAAEQTERVITQEVVRYVQAEATAGSGADCLDGDWVRIHDLAATDRMPEAADPAAHPDGPATGATPGEALTAVTDNYGTCNDIRSQLTSLQDWVRQTQAPYRGTL